MNFWAERWRLGQTGWHNNVVNTNLMNHAHTILNRAAPTIFVPLCGKSLDMKWLMEQGANVIGVDLVKQAIESFFISIDTSPEQKQLQQLPSFSIDNCTLLQANIFDVATEHIGSVDGIYDRAALVALPLNSRQAYVDHCLSLLKPGGHILLITYDAPVGDEQGPPFPVRKGTIETLYASASTCELLEEVITTPDNDERLAKRGLDWSRSDIWKITK